jgi:hypothetical protein
MLGRCSFIERQPLQNERPSEHGQRAVVRKGSASDYGSTCHRRGQSLRRLGSFQFLAATNASAYFEPNENHCLQLLAELARRGYEILTGQDYPLIV